MNRSRMYCGYDHGNGRKCMVQVRRQGVRCTLHRPEALAYAEQRRRRAAEDEADRKRFSLKQKLTAKQAQLQALTSEIDYLQRQLKLLEPAEPVLSTQRQPEPVGSTQRQPEARA